MIKFDGDVRLRLELVSKKLRLAVLVNVVFIKKRVIIEEIRKVSTQNMCAVGLDCYSMNTWELFNFATRRLYIPQNSESSNLCCYVNMVGTVKEFRKTQIDIYYMCDFLV